MNLQQVKPGFVLTLPQAMWAQSDTQVRAKPGEIIDLDVPGEAELVAGQHYKLQPAPEGSVPTLSAVKIPRIAVFLREAAAKAAQAAAQQPAPPAPAAHAGAPATNAPQPDPEAVQPAASKPRAPARSGGQSSLPTVDPLPNVPAKG